MTTQPLSMKQKNVCGYRWLTKDLKSEHGNVEWKPGEWKKQDGKLELCRNGFHASREPLDSLNYDFGVRWFHCEARGEILEDNDKFIASEMRVTKEIVNAKNIVVAFAIACAKRSLKYFEEKNPDDLRPRKAIEAAEAWLQNPTKQNEAARAAEAAEAAEKKWQKRKLKQLIRNQEKTT